MLKHLVHTAGRRYLQAILRSEFQSQRLNPSNERPIELAFLFQAMREFRPQSVLDIGPGDSPLPALIRNCGPVVTAIDNVSDYWANGVINRHWHVLDQDIRRPSLNGASFDMVSCVSVIEHIPEHAEAFVSMSRLVKPGGHVVVTMPYTEHRYVDNVYALPGAKVNADIRYICRSYSRAEVDAWVKRTGLQIARQEYWRLYSGDVWRQGEILPEFNSVGPDEPHHLTCIVFTRPV